MYIFDSSTGQGPVGNGTSGGHDNTEPRPLKAQRIHTSKHLQELSTRFSTVRKALIK